MASKGATPASQMEKVELPKEAVAAGRKVVLDSGAIIKGGRLESLGERFWTVAEVLNEVRDGNARMVLETTSADIQVREVDPAAIAHVSKFAKLTGDFAKLSAVDMKVLALTYQLERQFCGTAHLNEKPRPTMSHSTATATNSSVPEEPEEPAENGAQQEEAGGECCEGEASAAGAEDASDFERVPMSKPDALDAAEAAAKKRPFKVYFFFTLVTDPRRSLSLNKV